MNFIRVLREYTRSIFSLMSCVFPSGFNEKRMIKRAMAHWSEETCVRFEEYDRNKHGDHAGLLEKPQRLRFVAGNDGYVYKHPTTLGTHAPTHTCTSTSHSRSYTHIHTPSRTHGYTYPPPLTHTRAFHSKCILLYIYTEPVN